MFHVKDHRCHYALGFRSHLLENGQSKVTGDSQFKNGYEIDTGAKPLEGYRCSSSNIQKKGLFRATLVADCSIYVALLKTVFMHMHWVHFAKILPNNSRFSKPIF